MLWRCRCRRTQYSNIFSSETPWQIKTNLHVEHPYKWGTNMYINGRYGSGYTGRSTPTTVFAGAI